MLRSNTFETYPSMSVRYSGDISFNAKSGGKFIVYDGT
jgi:hypothetical protein